MNNRLLSLVALTMIGAASMAIAAPVDELHESFGKFLAAKSFHATITDVKKNKALSEMDFVAPDRYHLRNDGQDSFIIGDAMYMDLGGQMSRVPVPGVGKITAQYRNEGFLREMEKGMTVEALPDETVDGEAARVYAYTQTQPVKAQSRIWVSKKTGLPIMVESSARVMGMDSTTRVRYSRFNDPSIQVDAPN